MSEISIAQFPTDSISLNNTAEENAIRLENAAKAKTLLWNRAAIEESAQIYLEAAEIRRRIQQESRAARCWREIGKLKIILGEKKEAEKFFKQALEVFDKEKLLAEKAILLSDLSHLALTDGNYPDSRKYFVQSETLAKRTFDATALASAYFSAAEYYYYNSDLLKSDDFLALSVKFWKQAGDDQGEALSLLKSGYLKIDVNEYYAALELLNLALGKWEKTGDLRGQAITLKAIGTVYNVTNEKQKALEYYKNAERLIPKDIDYFEQAGLFNSFGSIYEYYGDLKLSAEYREKALEFFRKDNHSFGQLATLTSLFRLNSLLKNDDLALEYFSRAEKLARKSGNKFYLALNETQMGTFFYNRGNFQDAEKSYRKTLKLLQISNNTRQISLVSAKLGKIHEQKNEWQTAYKLHTDSLRMNQRVKDDFAEADTLFNLAQIENLLGRPDALQLAKRSIHLTETLYSDVDNSKLKRSYFSSVFERYELFINLLMKMHRQSPDESHAIEALRAAEKSRARLMLESIALVEADFTKDAAPEIVKREKEIRVLLNSKADKLTDLLSRNADNTEIDKLDGEIGELENELEEIKGKLKQQSPIYSAIKNPAPFDAADFQKNVLDEDSLLLEFSFGKEESYLWLVGKNEFSSYVLPPRERIESRIEKLRKLIDSRGMLEGETVENYQARIAADEIEFGREAADFSRELLGQVADKLSNKRLIIVPDGKLHYFPIAALPHPNSIDNVPILLTNETVYEPSAATLALLMRNGKKISAAPKNLLVFSDPIFSNQDARIAAAGSNDETQPENDLPKAEKFRFAESLTSLARLNASRDEADAIVEIVGASASTALGGAAATRERALDASISDYKIIHFATHGLIDEKRPELSGIVLSQVDETGQSRNGVVRLQDIYAMNLSADAVILSACNTGVGKEVKGEGLLSLNNAFLQAGAKSVVSSLWKVDDYAARELMKNFYREMTSGMTTAEALRRAQIKMRKNPQYQSPFYWAAFTVQGDFQVAPQLAAGFDYRIYGWMVLPFALILIYIYRRRVQLFNRKIINVN